MLLLLSLLLSCSCQAALPESLNSVPYPNPEVWSHAWPYDTSNAVQLSPSITVTLDAASSAPAAARSADSTSADPLVAEIIARWVKGSSPSRSPKTH